MPRARPKWLQRVPDAIPTPSSSREVDAFLSELIPRVRPLPVELAFARMARKPRTRAQDVVGET